VRPEPRLRIVAVGPASKLVGPERRRRPLPDVADHLTDAVWRVACSVRADLAGLVRADRGARARASADRRPREARGPAAVSHSASLGNRRPAQAHHSPRARSRRRRASDPRSRPTRRSGGGAILRSRLQYTGCPRPRARASASRLRSRASVAQPRPRRTRGTPPASPRAIRKGATSTSCARSLSKTKPRASRRADRARRPRSRRRRDTASDPGLRPRDRWRRVAERLSRSRRLRRMSWNRRARGSSRRPRRVAPKGGPPRRARGRLPRR
jgi:hypothetical protein